MNIGADHEPGYGTDLKAEIEGNLWRIRSGNTRLDGSASYRRHFGGLSGDGKSKVSGALSLSHNY